MSTLTESDIPCFDILKTEAMSVNLGECLEHFSRLTKLTNVNRAHSYKLCMGALAGSILHCWIESGEVVADLTLNGALRFQERSRYYDDNRIKADEVRRYTHAEAFRKVFPDIRQAMAAGATFQPDKSTLTFWGFDGDQFQKYDPATGPRRDL